MGSAFRYSGRSITSAMGLDLIVFSFLVGAVGAPSAIRDLGSNAVASITRDDAGLYTILLNQPRPAQMVAGDGWFETAVADISASTTGAKVNITDYDPDTGEFTLQTMTDDGDTTYTVEDVTDGTRVNVVLYMQSVNALVQS